MVCAFFTASVHRAPSTNRDRAACAVPAAFADRSFGGAPACGPPGEAPDYVHEWAQLALGDGGEVECLVPRFQTYVPANRCMDASTSSGALAGLQRAYAHRFVYLVHSHAESLELTARVNRAQRASAVALLVAGTLLLVLANTCCCLVHGRDVARRTRSHLQSRRERRIERDRALYKIY